MTLACFEKPELSRALQIERTGVELANHKMSFADLSGAYPERAADRGVRVRLLYNLDEDKHRVPVPPPPRTEPDLVEALPFPTVAVPGWPDLMHHKYVIRDRASVWSGWPSFSPAFFSSCWRATRPTAFPGSASCRPVRRPSPSARYC